MDKFERRMFCVVCGVKNSGKTTLIEKLIREFRERGIITAVIKHDGHDFTCDIPGTDSARFSKAGALGTAVFSRSRIFIHRRELSHSACEKNTDTEEYILWEQKRAEELAEFFPDAHMVLFEGLKNTSLPKIEVVRSAISDLPASNPAGRFLIVSDLPNTHFRENVLGLSQIREIADAILNVQPVKESGE